MKITQMMSVLPIASVTRASLVVVAACALAIAGGCSFTRPAPVKAQYLLSPKTPPVAAKPQPGTLRIGIVNVAGPFRDRNFVLKVGDLRYETDYYDEFVVPPSAILAEQTSRALSRSRAFAHVGAPGAPVQADYVLDGFVSALYADHTVQGRCKAVIAINYYLSQADTGSGVPFWSEDYRREVDCGAGDADAYVAALNTALSEILVKLAGDLGAAKLPAAP
jgi:cholesterol transport system auxiliary component